MFRESDYQPPKLHPSYEKKPLSLLQHRAKLSQFEDTRSTSVHDGRMDQPPAVPVSHDTVYDPSHPDADWNGMVSKQRAQKKHTQGHRSQMSGIATSEDGLVSKEERAEWSRLRRPSDPKLRGADDLISGIPTEGDHYMTNYQRQTNGIQTSNDQLTLMKRGGHRKVIQDPAQSTRQKQSEGGGPMEGQYRQGHNIPTEQENESPFGYRPQAMGGSLMSSLGSSLVSRVDPPPKSTPKGGYSKTLISENFNSAPGYTGRRKLN
eukprot:CAMPEP_0185040774 /NCGR_PEP_ID=MMETSP1103-20130426/39240_1 /TAXON_ID=36769 /ORGANISM="Paraphysomonas bandaiensis, Strain Caron Lab Isolate" /LENGTH=262 /DNA_ID=CAMNT_0027580205 /DNA_START=87 /DNA_END=875 /DNA_ORIENTATION=-